MPNPFDNVKGLTQEQEDQMQAVRDGAKDFHNLLASLPRTRSVSIAITKLEECAMWAIKAITHKE